ncbi:hypothetical protein ABZV93_04550 [Actinopolymorpha sp. NPDC004070]|uniref:hypothetical protein n=1 Tax=Actinopolymorpha sp. NPDC004070 TaxID=3154548 RepID=UPI0033B9BFA7
MSPQTEHKEKEHTEIVELPAMAQLGIVLAALVASGGGGYLIDGDTGLLIGLGVLLLLGLAGRGILHLLDWYAVRDVPDALVTPQVARTLGDQLGAVFALVEEWRVLCERAHIDPIPPVEVRREGVDAAIVLVGDGPRLAVHEDLASAPPAVRTHRLAHEAARLIAGQYADDSGLQTARLVPTVAYVTAIVATALAMFTGSGAWLLAAGTAGVLWAVARLMVASWSRARTYAADAVAAHVLGVRLDAETTQLLCGDDPLQGSTFAFADQPGWADRHAAIHDHAERLGSPTTGTSPERSGGGV